MGLLSEGTPLNWADTVQHCAHVRKHGIDQLLHTLKTYGNRHDDPLLWGDEVEYIVIKLDPKQHNVVVGLRQEAILGKLLHVPDSANVSFHPEYGRFMVESTPLKPFDGSWDALLALEPNMANRRKVASPLLDANERMLSIPVYPLLGVGTFTETGTPTEGPVTKSLFLPDDVINLHPRFPTLSQNIRQRRGKKVEIAVPVYKDVNTVWPWKDPLTESIPNQFPPNSIYMDAMGFGMGCCCLQLTFQGDSIDGARDLYDAFVPLTPLFLALSAGSPIFRGVLADQDVRWNVISQAVDDRTDAEKKVIPKSRYDSVDLYISRTNKVLHKNTEFYNDIPVATNDGVTEQLKNGGLKDDELLVKHFSHFFNRDPLVVFQELLDQDDTKSMDHFENIQSTNWQTVRFKPPPNSEIGWRVEFRPLEIQITDFENAAFGVLVLLLVRAIKELNLNFYQPISQVDENMKRAHARDPVHRSKFWVRVGIRNQTAESKPEFKELSLNEIFNGSSEYEGLIPVARKILVQAPVDVQKKLEPYLQLLSKRASGELDTAATWIRKFVNAHPDYKHDSIIPMSVNYDLINAIAEISEGKGWNGVGKSMLGGILP